MVITDKTFIVLNFYTNDGVEFETQCTTSTPEETVRNGRHLSHSRFIAFVFAEECASLHFALPRHH